MKKCSNCQILKEPTTEHFYPDKHRTDGLNAVCRLCSPKLRKENYERNKVLKIKKEARDGHKFCSKCGSEKPKEAFKPNKNIKSGLDSWCRDCHKQASYEQAEKYRELHPKPQAQKEGHKICSKCKTERPFDDFKLKFNKKKGIFKMDSWCQQCYKINGQERYQANLSEERKKGLDYYYAHKERAKQYYLDNKEKAQQYQLQWIKDNPEYRKQWEKDNPGYSRKYLAKKMKTDPCYAMSANARAAIHQFIHKKKGFSIILGCDWQTFKSHIEAVFTHGMSWDNHGEWHVDHLYPLVKAWKDGFEHFVEACKYKNLGPKWAKDNLKKHDNLIPEDFVDKNGNVTDMDKWLKAKKF
jgi:hypothetical protein